jgi:hypothetical protein
MRGIVRGGRNLFLYSGLSVGVPASARQRCPHDPYESCRRGRRVFGPASELSRLPVCVFAGHHGTCPFKCDLHIQYAFRYTLSLILLRWLSENDCVISRRVSLGCEWERRLGFAASGRRDEDHPSEIADRTKGHFDFSAFLRRARGAPDILSVQPDAVLWIVSRWWTAIHYISRRNSESS